MSPTKQPKKRRSLRPLDQMPSLFDSVDIDLTRNDIAGDVIARHQRHVAQNADNQAVELDPLTLPAIKKLKFVSFGSGSSGNCAYIGTDKSGVLIDAGVDAEVITDRLKQNGIDIKTVKGILLTHDHSDHLRFAYNLLRHNKHMLLYATPRCMNGVFRRSSISRRIKDYHKAIYKEIPFQVGGLDITAFETSHDGTDNVGFAITHSGLTFVITTDTGIITPRADHYMRQANCLMIEANYDLPMLLAGPYPNYLKARIQGPTGHLDNQVTAQYLAQIASPRLSHVFLCHLSDDNNTPAIAIKTVTDALTAAGFTVGQATGSMLTAGVDIQLSALPRFEQSPLFTLRPRH